MSLTPSKLDLDDRRLSSSPMNDASPMSINEVPAMVTPSQSQEQESEDYHKQNNSSVFNDIEIAFIEEAKKLDTSKHHIPLADARIPQPSSNRSLEGLITNVSTVDQHPTTLCNGPPLDNPQHFMSDVSDFSKVTFPSLESNGYIGLRPIKKPNDHFSFPSSMTESQRRAPMTTSTEEITDLEQMVQAELKRMSVDGCFSLQSGEMKRSTTESMSICNSDHGKSMEKATGDGVEGSHIKTIELNDAGEADGPVEMSVSAEIQPTKNDILQGSGKGQTNSYMNSYAYEIKTKLLMENYLEYYEENRRKENGKGRIAEKVLNELRAAKIRILEKDTMGNWVEVEDPLECVKGWFRSVGRKVRDKINAIMLLKELWNEFHEDPGKPSTDEGISTDKEMTKKRKQLRTDLWEYAKKGNESKDKVLYRENVKNRFFDLQAHEDLWGRTCQEALKEDPPYILPEFLDKDKDIDFFVHKRLMALKGEDYQNLD